MLHAVSVRQRLKLTLSGLESSAKRLTLMCIVVETSATTLGPVARAITAVTQMSVFRFMT